MTNNLAALQSDHKHWSDEEECIKSNKPLKLALMCIKHIPAWLIMFLMYPIVFGYYLFAPRARKDALLYQHMLKEYTKGYAPKKISSYRQIMAFSINMIEKMFGWLGKIPFDKLTLQNDDFSELTNLLEQGKGAFLIGSHLGNMEILRSLTSFGRTGVSKKFSVTIVQENVSAEQFNKTLEEINPDVIMNVVDSQNIGPDTIFFLQEQIDNGGLVVIAGDRTSARSRSRIIRKAFLGKNADFPYGVFLIPFLLSTPVFYIFGMRKKNTTMNFQYNMYIEKSKIDFDCSRSERNSRVEALCEEYISKLEKICAEYPYQWYNFYNFWLPQENIENE
ncbi:MAG: hypothetical protein K5829_04135 [Treponema sp.]|nr:hypothetical protein [Treponema sp.]